MYSICSSTPLKHILRNIAVSCWYIELCFPLSYADVRVERRQEMGLEEVSSEVVSSALKVQWEKLCSLIYVVITTFSYVNITEASSIVFLQCWWILSTSELIAHLNNFDIN